MREIKLILLLAAFSLTAALQGCNQTSKSDTVQNSNTNQSEFSNANGDGTLSNAAKNSETNNQAVSNVNYDSTVNRKPVSKVPEPKPSVGGAGDLSIVMSVRGKLSSEKDLINNVIVDAKEGNVTLTGKVSNEEQKRKAEDLTRSVPGIKNIKNNLRISQ